MKIYVNNKQLDGVEYLELSKDVGIASSSELDVAYSVDFDLPRSLHNDNVLDLRGMLNRGQMFGTMIDCEVVSPIYSGAASMTVNEVSDSMVSLTVYIQADNKLSQKLRDVLDEYIKPMTTPIQTTATALGDFEIEQYMYFDNGNTPTSTDFAKRKPNPYLRLPFVFKDIAVRGGVPFYDFLTLMSSVDLEALLPSTFWVSPYQKWQWLVSDLQIGFTSGSTSCYTDYDGGLINDGEAYKTKVTFNRDVRVKLYLFAGRVAAMQPYECSMLVLDELGRVVGNHYVIDSGANNYVSTGPILYTMKKGWSVRVSYGSLNPANNAVVGIEYLFAATDNYPVESDWNSVRMARNNGVAQVGETGNLQDVYVGLERAVISVFDMRANVGNITVGDFLRVFAASKSLEVLVSGSGVKFVSMSSDGVGLADCEAEITEWSPVSDSVGRETYIDWGGKRQSSWIESDRLNESVDLYEDNPLYYGQRDIGGNLYAVLPHVDANWKQQNPPQLFSFVKQGTVAGWLDSVAVADYGYLTGIQKCLEVHGTSHDRQIAEKHLVNIDAKLYLITSWDYDEETMTYEFTALQLTPWA